MKNKITAVLLCLTLLVTLSVNVTADDLNIITDSNAQIVDSQIGLEPIVQDDSISTTSATSGIKSGAVYRIKNIGSGKYMNVHYGVDANGTNIYQWTGDGSTEQKFRVVYFADSDSYMIYAMCSSNGDNRVVDVTRGSAPLTHGQNIKLYNPTDPTSQQFKIVLIGQGQYRISMKANQNLYLAAYGNLNGSASGTSATSAGNIYLSNYVGEMYQHWGFELVENPPDPTGNFELVNSSKVSGWAYQTGLPDTPIQAHIYIKNNSTGSEVGYATYADKYRADLYAAGYGDGEHAFSYGINWCSYPSGTYTVSVYGINAYDGTNPHLGNSPRTFTVRKATGNMEALTSTGVSGWAWKPDAPDDSIQVHLYIRTLDGETVMAYPTIANSYRPDLYEAGYGDGYHGYSIPIDWSTLPEEKLRVTLYAVDGSNENPTLYDGYYDNSIIHLVGMIDDEGKDFSAWMTQEVMNYAADIGSSRVVKHTGATQENLIEYIHNSRFATIFTHGTQYTLAWKANANTETETKGSLGWRQVGAIDVDYFSNTDCLLLLSCFTASKADGAGNNIAETIKSKGIGAVVAFEDKIAAAFKNNKVLTTQYVGYWRKVFLRELGEGSTVELAKIIAFSELLQKQREILEINTSELEILIENDPEYVEKHLYCGTNSCVILGDGNIVVRQ